MITPNTTPDKKRTQKKQAGTPAAKATGALYQQKILSPPRHDGFVYGLEHKKKKHKSQGVPDKTGHTVLNSDDFAYPQAFFPKVGLEGQTQKSVDDAILLFEKFTATIDSKLPAESERTELLGELRKITTILKKNNPQAFTAEANSYISKLTNDIQIYATGAGSRAKNTALLIGFLGASLYYSLSPSHERLTILGIAAGTLIVFSNIFTDMSLLGHVMVFFGNLDFSVLLSSSVDEAIPQFGHTDIDKCVTGTTALLAAYTTSIGGKACPMELFKNIGTIGRAKQTISEIVVLLLETCQNVTNWFRNDVLSVKSVRFIESNIGVIETYLNDVDVIREEERLGKFYRNSSNFLRLKAIIAVGEKMTMQLGRDKESAGASESLRNVLKDLNGLRKVFEGSNFTLSGSRQEPVGVMFKGGPGTGKSICMEHLVYAVCAYALTADEFEAFKKNPATFVYNRQFENKFWDGYTVQMLVTMLDDFGQFRDVAGNPDGEAANVIRMNSGFQMNLHMAELSAKASSMFGSKFTFGTTNLEELKFESVISDEAVKRRFDFTFIVAPKDEYCVKPPNGVLGDLWTRRFDASKLPTVDIADPNLPWLGSRPVTQLHPSLQDFWLENWRTKERTGPYSFDDVVKMTTDCYDMKRLRFLAQSRDFESTLDKYRFQSSRFENDDLVMKDLADITVPQSCMKDQSDYMNRLYNTPVVDWPGAELDEGMEMPDVSVQDISEAEALAYLDRIDVIPSYSVEAIQRLIGGFEKPIQVLTQMLMRQLNGWSRECAKTRYRELVRICETTYARNIFLDYPTPVVIANLIIVYGRPFVVAFQQEILTTLEISINWDVERNVMNPPVPWKFKYSPDKVRGSISKVRKFFNDIWESHPIQVVFGFVQKYEAYILGILGLVSIPLLYRYISPVICSLFGVTKPESMNFSDRMHATKPKGKFKSMSADEMAKHLDAKTVPQGGHCIDSSGVDLIKSICISNQYQFWTELCVGTSGYGKPGYLFMVKDTIAVMPVHFITQMQANVVANPAWIKARVRLVKTLRHERTHEYMFEVGDFLKNFRFGKLKANDLVLVKLPTPMQVCRNIVENFALRKDYETIKRNIPFLMVCSDKTDREYFYGNAQAEDKPLYVSGGQLEDYYVRDHYSYEAFTDVGDCGAPFAVLNPALQKRKFFGMHVAANGNRQRSYAASICQEDLLEDLALFDAPLVDDKGPDMVVVPEDPSFTIAQGQFNVLGHLIGSPSRNVHTEIVKSRVHGAWKPALTGTAQLTSFMTDDGVVDPVSKALSKYCYPSILIDRILVDNVKESYQNFLFNIPSNRITPRLFTFREAVNGVEDVIESHGISCSSSAGYPMSVAGEVNLKKWLFMEGREGEEFEKRFSELTITLQNLEIRYINGERPFWVFTDCLKDERRELEKCRLGKTRLFSGCPFLYLILWKRYFGAFQLQFHAQRITNGSAVGMNVYSAEWHALAKNLTKFDSGETFVGAGDFSGFDGSEKPIIHYAILDIINAWYDDGELNKRIRTILWMEVVNSRHVIDGVLCEWSSSLPSGHPFTIIINCMYNHFSFRMSWVKLDLRLEDFDANVYLIVCGDDNAFTVHPRFRGDFNEISLVKPMAELGLTYTTELKEMALYPFRGLADIEFMKRSFRWEPLRSLFIAPLRLEVVLEIPYWTKRKWDRDNIAASNIIEALRELSLHDKQIYDEWEPKMIRAFEAAYPGLETPGPLRDTYMGRQSFTCGWEKYV